MNTDELPPYVEVVIGYGHKYRKVYVTSVHRTNEGNWCITGWDPDVNEGEGGWRTFREDRLNGNIHLVKAALDNR